MRKRTAVTTGEIAAHCQVTPDAVIYWIKTGKLNAYATPGGHRRISIEEFRAFLQAYNMPPFGEAVPAKRKILIVDDEPNVTGTIAKLLGKAEKYELAVARDGFEAGLQIMAFCPDLVVLDLMMPQLDGFQVCRRIKSTSATEHIKVLVLTGYPTDDNISNALECGADCCMAKPIKGDDLREKIKEMLAGNCQMYQRA